MPVDLDDPEVAAALPSWRKTPRVQGKEDRRLPRQVSISKSLSRLLRHQAKAEGITITPDGWVRLDHLLKWQMWRSTNRFSTPVTMEEIFNVVEQNDKQRFALKHLRTNEITGIDLADVEQGKRPYMTGSVPDLEETLPLGDESSTNHALAIHNSGKDITPSHFFIRATQGHSMEEITTDGLLIPISLDNPESIPKVVVHGTFYGAWSNILKDGGLKKMRRNMVHFASGPALTEVLPEVTQNKGDNIAETLEREKVISGMRRDAQILIYINLQRCLEDIRTRKLDMTWWQSENGVILTEGVQPDLEDISTLTEVEDINLNAVAVEKAERKQLTGKARQPIPPEKMVPTKYWDVVVDVKSGLGVLWRQGEGVVKELPKHLQGKGVPRGKDRGPRGHQGKRRG